MHKKNPYDFCLFSILADGKRVIREITNTCNYMCSYCIFSSGAYQQTNELTTDEVIHTLEEFKKEGITHLKLTGGEPFVRRDMIDILGYASRLGFHIDISTNASLITDEIAEKLSKLHLEYVHVSLDAHTDKIQSLVRGKGSFDRTIAGIKKLVEHKVHIRIGTLIFKDNENDTEKMIKFLIQLGANEVIFSLMEPVGRMMGKTGSVSTRTKSSLIQEIQRYQKRYAKDIKISYAFTPEKEMKQASKAVCPGANKFRYINNKGEVSPCTWIVQFMKEFQSNETLKTHSFKEINNQGANRKFREILTTLAKYGITGCPKSFLPIFKEFQTIKELFDGDFEKNILKSGKYGTCSPLYSFATENISGYYPLYDFKNKDILTVGSSGDHAINALLLGAKHVDCFDVNLLSKFFIDLKCTALTHLDFATFKDFFFRDTRQTLSKKIYDNLASHLQPSSRYFFDELYKQYKTGAEIRESILFNNLYDTKKSKIRNNLYLKDNHAFLLAKKEIEHHQINFIHAALQDICQRNLLAEKKYDAIFLSNISDYSKTIFPEKQHLQSFNTTVINYLLQHSNKDGIVMIGYVYGNDKKRYRSEIDDPKIRKKIFRYTGYKEVEIPSVLDNRQKDIVLYTKR